MAGLWGMYRNRREDGDCHFEDQDVVHLHFFSNLRLTCCNLYDSSILDEHETLYSSCAS